MTRPPWLLIAAWGLSLVAAALVVQRDTHYQAELWHGQQPAGPVTPFLWDTTYFGFFKLHEGAYYADLPPFHTAEGAQLRFVRFSGLAYCAALAALAIVIFSSPFWYGLHPTLRNAALLFGPLAPLAALLVFGLAVHSFQGPRPIEGWSLRIKPTWTSWVAAAVWFLALIVSVAVIRAERRPRVVTEPAVFE